MEKILINKFSLAYKRLGQGAPLVLIHGYPLDHSIWDEVIPLLSSDPLTGSGQAFDLILPDLRGFGASDSTATPYSMADLASDIAGLLDHLGIESAFIAGHSMGGYVALAFAQAHPSRVRGLALVSSQAAADPPERKAGRYANAKQIAEDGIGETVAGMTSKLSADARVQKFVHDLMKRQKPAGFVGSLRAMAEREDMLSMLTSASFPLTLIHGDADGLIPVGRAHEIQSVAPRARLFTLAGLGHMPMLENPQATSEALKSFV
jgi:pimeloyl-ACP methyl ester carboxylesterase